MQHVPLSSRSVVAAVRLTESVPALQLLNAMAKVQVARAFAMPVTSKLVVKDKQLLRVDRKTSSVFQYATSCERKYFDDRRLFLEVCWLRSVHCVSVRCIRALTSLSHGVCTRRSSCMHSAAQASPYAASNCATHGASADVQDRKSVV